MGSNQKELSNIVIMPLLNAKKDRVTGLGARRRNKELKKERMDIKKERIKNDE